MNIPFFHKNKEDVFEKYNEQRSRNLHIYTNNDPTILIKQINFITECIIKLLEFNFIDEEKKTLRFVVSSLYTDAIKNCELDKNDSTDINKILKIIVKKAIYLNSEDEYCLKNYLGYPSPPFDFSYVKQSNSTQNSLANIYKSFFPDIEKARLMLAHIAEIVL